MLPFLEKKIGPAQDSEGTESIELKTNESNSLAQVKRDLLQAQSLIKSALEALEKGNQ